MGTQQNAIIGLGLLLALVVAGFLLFRNFDLGKVTEDVEKAFNEFGTGISEFIDDTGKGFNEFVADVSGVQDIKNVDTSDPFFNDNKPSLGSPREALDVLDSNSETFQEDAQEILAEKFGITGVDKITLLDNGGLHIEQFDRPDTKKDTDFFSAFANFFSIPTAFGEKSPEEFTVIDARPTETPKTLSDFTKRNRPSRSIKNQRTKQGGNTRIEGNVISQIDSPQQFKVFSSDSSKTPRGRIFKTRRDPRKLRVNSRNRPTETASARANRVFVEQGKFAGEGRGFNITKARDKTRNFNFGSNQGRALRIVTSGLTARKRLAERKRLATNRALSVFDSRSISNF